MGLFHLNKQKEHNFKQTPRKALPPDHSLMTCGPDACHCVDDKELDIRYNKLRVMEHALMDGLAGPEWSRAIAYLPENVDRNRYASITPWDHSRVKLPVREGGNDYINASWIQMGSKTYLASQGPLNSTVPHFWQMAYAYGGNPIVIVMLTALFENSVEKCAKYWPDSKDEVMEWPASNGDFHFGLKVTLEKTVQNEQYNYSQLKLTPDNPEFPSKLVHHIYYHSWLDFSKPNMDADLRSLIYLVNNKLKNPGAPPIVHCSAGIGRTGTFIAIDSLLSKIDGDINVSNGPESSPVWSLDPSSYVNRATPFTGPADSIIELGESSLKSGNSYSFERNPQHDSVQSAPADISVDPLNLEKVPLESVKTKVSSLSAALSGERGTQPLTGVAEEQANSQANGQVNGQVNGQANGHGQVKDHDLYIDTDAPSLSESTNEAIETAEGHHLQDKKDQNAASSGPGSGSGSSSGSAKTGPVLGSAKKGPALRASAEQAVPKEVLELRPGNIDVVNWYTENDDPVLGAIQVLRLQRPKMVQGTQQLGYIYDQFEVGQQFAKAIGQRPERRATFDQIGSYQSDKSLNGYSTTTPRERKDSVSSQSSSHKKFGRTNTFTSLSTLFSSSASRHRGASLSNGNAAPLKRGGSVRG